MTQNWVTKKASVDLDFANRRYFGTTVFEGTATPQQQGCIDGVAATGGGSFTLSSSGLYEPGYWNTPRITRGFGLWAEEKRICITTQNRSGNQAIWVKANCTAARNVTGVTGVANSATRVTATANNATILQTHVNTSQLAVQSVFVQRITGTGTVELTADTSGAYTDITAQLAAVPVGNFVRVSLPSAVIPVNTIAGLRLGTSGDVIAFDFFQLETQNDVALINPATPTSPMETAGGTFIRYNDEPCFGSFQGGYWNDGFLKILQNVFTYGGPWWYAQKYTGTPTATKPGWLLSSDGNCIISGGADGGPCKFQGASSPNNGNAGFGNWNAMCGAVDWTGARVCLNGGAISARVTGGDNFPVPPNRVITHCGIGNNGGSNNEYPLNGPTARIAMGRGEVTDSFMRELTLSI